MCVFRASTVLLIAAGTGLVLHAYTYGVLCWVLFGGIARKRKFRTSWPSPCNKTPGRPRFREDGTFKIVQFTDIHMQCYPSSVYESLETINNVLNTECPDFVAYTGDVCEVTFRSCSTASNQALMMDLVVDPSEFRGIPWAMTYGNWDRWPDAFWTGPQLNDFFVNGTYDYKYNLNKAPPPDLRNGDSVFDIEVPSHDGTSAAVLYFLDTMANEACNVPGKDSGTGCLDSTQVAWYDKMSEKYRQQRQGQPLPAVAFFHVPISEYIDAWNGPDSVGYLNEETNVTYDGISCAREDGSFFKHAKANGDVLAMTCGHDHNNNFHAKYQGISLMYGQKTGFGSYGPDFGDHPGVDGARVIQLSQREGAVEMETWIRTNDGRKITQTHIDQQPIMQRSCNYGS